MKKNSSFVVFAAIMGYFCGMLTLWSHSNNRLPNIYIQSCCHNERDNDNNVDDNNNNNNNNNKVLVNNNNVKSNGDDKINININRYFASNLTRPRLRPSKELCSFEIFRDYVARSSGFPHQGTWSSVHPRRAYYQPDICSFPYQQFKDVPKTYTSQCLRSKGISNVLLLGDSNGRRYYKAFMDLLVNTSGYDCLTLKMEVDPTKTKMPDPTYFTNDTNISLQDVFVHQRDCWGCYSTKNKCLPSRSEYGGTSFPLGVEYIGMDFMIDTEVITFRKYRRPRCPPIPRRCTHSPTYQQFLLSEYLDNNYPDLVFFFSNNHDLRRKTAKQMRADTITLFSLLKTYLPVTTKVIWLDIMGETPERKPPKWQHEAFEEFPGLALGIGETIRAFNDVIFSVLQPEMMNQATNFLPFLSLESMSRDILQTWSVDGVHMLPEWYEHIISYLVQSLCR